jgi:hypothetical protein
MWRRRQALSTVQRWLGNYRAVGIMGSHRHLSSSPSVRSIHGGVACSGASNLSSTNASWQSILSDVSHPSSIRYGDVRLFSSRGGHHRPRIPRMKDLYSVAEVVTTAYDNRDLMSRRDVSAVWARIPQLMTKRTQTRHAGEEFSIEDMRIMIETIFDDTTDGMIDCSFREITETTLGMAKIVQILRKRAGRRGEDAYRIVLRELLLNEDNRTANKELFQFIAEKSMDIIHESDARCLSNIAYAYALIGYVPQFEDGSDLFDHIAMHSIEMRAEFNAQDLSNMVWAYATVKKRHDALFQAMGDHIVGLDHLEECKPQNLSNIVWAYATAGVNHPKMFEKMANLIIQLDQLRDFKPQELSNTVWAYATAGVNHPDLYEKIGKHIVEVGHLRDFRPQALSNIVWAYATVKKRHDALFKAMGDHIVTHDRLRDFKPQEISNTVWAYATAGVNHPQLFEKIGKHIVKPDHLRDFDPQALSNTVWAYATAQVSHPDLFEKVGNHIVLLKSLDRFTHPQDVSNTVWAYATAGANHPKLFEKMANHIVGLDHSRYFNTQDLSNTVWAYATSQVSHPKMFHQVARAAIQGKNDFISQHVANLLWSYAMVPWESSTSNSSPHFVRLLQN